VNVDGRHQKQHIQQNQNQHILESRGPKALFQPPKCLDWIPSEMEEDEIEKLEVAHVMVQARMMVAAAVAAAVAAVLSADEKVA